MICRHYNPVEAICCHEKQITDVRALACTIFHFIYLTFTAALYDGKHACFHMGVVRSISRLIHGIAMQMGASN